MQQQSVLFRCHAVPAAMSIPSAREMCGQPFLRDYGQRALLDAGRVGPVHIIACHRTVTESQAIKQLGIPDATIVTPPFGVYAADDIHKIQLVFLANCRDDTSTREQVGSFFTWLRQSGEGSWVAKRAAARESSAPSPRWRRRKRPSGWRLNPQRTAAAFAHGRVSRL